MKIKRLVFCLLASRVVYAETNEPFKLLVYPNTSSVSLLLPYLRKCPVITVITGGPKEMHTAPFLLETDTTGVRWRGTLYNNAGDELATFHGVRTATVGQQICHFFEGLKAAQPTAPTQ